MMKKTLITGGAGCMGSHLIRRFIYPYPDDQPCNLQMTCAVIPGKFGLLLPIVPLCKQIDNKLRSASRIAEKLITFVNELPRPDFRCGIDAKTDLEMASKTSVRLEEGLSLITGWYPEKSKWQNRIRLVKDRCKPTATAAD